MLLNSLTITDLLAFAGTATFPLHAVTLLEGDHGQGKTSFGEILLYAFGRRPLADPGGRGIAHDPSLIHGNAERGEAVITFDDGMTYRLLVTQDTTTRQVKMPDGKRWNAATPEFIDSLVNALSYNPFSFKDLDEKKRIEALLKASPGVRADRSEVENAVEGTILCNVSGETFGLETINQFYDQLYDLRRDANSRADISGKHAEELEKALPVETAAVADAAPLRAEKEALEKGERDLIEKCRRTLEEYKAEQQAAADADKTKIAKNINLEISELEAKRLQLYQETDARMSKLMEEARAIANNAVLSKRAELKPDLDRLTAEIATAEERALRSAKDDGAREAAKKARAAESTALADSTKLDTAMTRLKALKESVASRVAVPGVTIASPRKDAPVDICREQDDALCVCGHAATAHDAGDRTPCSAFSCKCAALTVAKHLVPFSRWNESDKELFCLRMAVLFHGKCGMVFVDEIGHFTPERRAALIGQAKVYAQEGMQFIMGCATKKGDSLRVVEG